MEENYSLIRLKEISNRVKEIEQLGKNQLCIYTTGSYGRLEASENSDLDLFFLDSDIDHPTSNIDKTLINADVIKICRLMSLPGLAKMVDILQFIVFKILRMNLEAQTMIIIIISQPECYCYLRVNLFIMTYYTKNVLNKIINPYFIDFHDHSQSFKPIFLTNDIIRFWKTLCLNYEHRRKRKSVEEEGGNKNVSHSKNLKLQFSRKLTCFFHHSISEF